MTMQSAEVSRASFGYLPEGVMTTIGDGTSTLTALRQWRGFTCSELSDRSGVDLIIIMLAERGSDLLPEERAAIAEILSVDPDLLGV
ncbi:hypothetical protein K32_12790 [Kaistia sp. 32K]|uniref:hypothetical protein n=1 Tax=Kaistia sp. 32K TaxID=2795690 RepID=UPI0019165EFA|nr:hypothetical protein [Kaistia sp. 32K]BCP52662.1 hypothetical protein K32_12790 [Kaistia sp. 32K]